MRNTASAGADLRERQRVFTMSFGMVALIGGFIAALVIIAAPWLSGAVRLDVTSIRYMMAIVYSDALLAVPYAHLRMTNRSWRYARAAYGMLSKDVVGIYSFNYKLGVAMLLVVQMFRLAWTPFSLQHARQRQAPQLYSRVLTALMLACAAVFLGVALFLPSLVQVPAVHRYIKPAYWVGLPIVPVILLGYVFSGMFAVVTAGLYIERKTGELPWIAGAGAILNVVICIAAESRWGMVGVAWATPAAYALMAALGAWRANHVYPVPFEWGRVAHLGAVVLAIFVADRLVAVRAVAPLSATGLSIKLTLLSALPIGLIVTGFFRRGEWRALRSLLPSVSRA